LPDSGGGANPGEAAGGVAASEVEVVSCGSGALADGSGSDRAAGSDDLAGGESSFDATSACRGRSLAGARTGAVVCGGVEVAGAELA
jgi:hypothetical protein